MQLYGGIDCDSLDKLRFFSLNRSVARQSLNAYFDLATLPPTSHAARLHSLRSYLQVKEWLGNKLNPCEWAWRQLSDGTLVPIPTTLPPAPDELLHLDTCNCKGRCARRCDCKNAGLSCSVMCGRCRGTSCGNTERVGDEQDDEDDCEIV